MSSGNTETRILQMQLENKDFEEGVRQTIKSLENLEEKLDLKNAGNGFEKVSAAANSVQMSHLESGLDTVTNKFTLMGQIGLQVLERISSRIIDTSEKVLRAATIQPMIDGWGEFEMKTNSVQTILGGIRNQFDDQPTAINAISEALDDLNTYADKTIYNFAQMTENVGKFTNQGLGLEESTNAIKGIANWAAAVGANPAQMSRAMYNISQSLGAGSMQLIDWRSIRFANMATPEVKKLFAEVAKVQGVISEDGTVKVGKQVFDVLEDFEASLKGGWLTNEVMAEAFSIYAKAFSETELIEKYGDDLGRQFYEMGVYAEEAATKVRTFSQLLGVLQESLGSGWANTFDILFGGFEQQTEFLTAIKERFEQIINFQTDDRNAWLQSFSNVGGIVVFQDTILKTLDILSDFYWVFNDVAALVLNPFGQSVFNMSDGIFGPRQEGYTELQNTWEGVKGVFDDISDTLTRFQRWLYKPNDSGRSPIHNLANALSGVAGAAGIAWQVLTGFGKMVFRLIKRFAPLVSSVLDLLGQIGGAIYNVFFNLTGQQSIEKIFENIGNAIEPVVDFVSGLASAVADLIHSFLGIDKAADDWTVLGERMQALWDMFKYNPELDFAQNLKNSLKNALVAVFGQDTASSMIHAWDTNIAPILESISGFFTQAFADMNRLLDGLRSAAAADYSVAESFEDGFDIFINALLKGAYKEDADGAAEAYSNILGIYQSIKTYYDENVAEYVNDLTEIFTVKLPALNTAISNFLFGYDEMTTDYDLVGKAKPVHHEGIFEKIEEFFGSETWQEDWGQITGAFEEISGWITSKGEAAWNTILDFLFGKEYDAGDGSKMRYGGAYNAAIEFLNPVWDWIQEKGNLLYDYITTHNFEEMWEDLGHLLFGYDEIIKNNLTPADSKNAFEPLDEFQKQIEEYEKAGSSTTVHHEGLMTPIIELLRPISEAFEQIKGWALDKIGNIDWASVWESIGKFFNGYDEVVTDTGLTGREKFTVHHEGAFEKITGFFDQIITYFQSPEFQSFLSTIKTFYDTYVKPVLEWFNGLGTELWGAIQGVFSGNGLGSFEGVGKYLTNGFNKLVGSIFPEGFDLQGILSGLFGGGLSSLFGGGGAEAGEAGQGSGGVFDMFGGFFEGLSGFFMGSASAAEAEEENIENAAGGIVAVLDKTKKDAENVSNKGTSAADSIIGSISKFLPYIGGAAALSLVGKARDIVVGFTGNRVPTLIEQLGALIRSFGEAFKGLGILMIGAGVAEWVRPGLIDTVFQQITNLLETVFKWVGIIGGGAVLGGIGGAVVGKLLGTGDISFSGIAKILSGIGEGMQGLFDGLQTLFYLTLEVAAADFFLGASNFDSKMQRVLGFIGEVLKTVLGNGVWLEIAAVANAFLSAGASKIGTGSQIESLATIMGGLGSLVAGIGEGVAAMMTASIVPSFMGFDTSKLVDLVNAVFTGLNGLIALKELPGVLNTITGIIGKEATLYVTINKIVDSGILLTTLTALGGLAGVLVDWYLGITEKHLYTMAPAVYTFISNVTGAISMLASIGETDLSAAESILTKDLPRLIGEINSEEIGFDKDKMDSRGSTIRDFGNRVYNGINKLAAAKDVFDKYNTDSLKGFPLEFFQEMTEALQYLQGDSVEELYDTVFGQGGFWFVGDSEEKPDVNGLNAFFSTLGNLGWALTEYNEFDGITSKSGTKLESTKEGLDAFQDAFSGIQTTFTALIGDISSEGFDVNKLDSLREFLTKIADAGVVFSSTYFYEHGNLKMFEDTSPIFQFSSWLQTMGTGIRQLNDNLKTDGVYDIDYTQIESALKSLTPMAELEKTLYEYSQQTVGKDGKPSREWMSNATTLMDGVMPKMKEFGTKLHEMASQIAPNDTTAIQAVSGAMTSLGTLIGTNVYDELGKMSVEQIGAYATAFGGLKDSLMITEGTGNSIASMIQEVMNATGGKEVQLRITPIVDDSNLGGQLPDGLQMENTYSRMITMHMNPNEIQNVRIDAAQISQLVEANNSTRDRIDTLAGAIRNIKIQVNVPSSGSAYGPRARFIEVYPLVANHQSSFADNP